MITYSFCPLLNHFDLLFLKTNTLHNNWCGAGISLHLFTQVLTQAAKACTPVSYMNVFSKTLLPFLLGTTAGASSLSSLLFFFCWSTS